MISASSTRGAAGVGGNALHGSEVRDGPQARDPLAFVRTVLALERTALAYVRTALAFAAVGVAVRHFFPNAWVVIAALGASTVLMFTLAAYRSVRVGRVLRTRSREGGSR